jgi:hypothetical protein
MRSARAPITDAFFYPYDTAWRQVHEPGEDVSQIFSLVAGATLCVGTLVLWLLLAPVKAMSVGYFALLVALLLVVVLHELTHVVAFTCRGHRALRVDLVWRRHRPQLRYDGALSRTHYLVVLAAPFFVISLAPIAVCVLMHAGYGDLVLISLVNALFSGADLVAIVHVRASVPARAIVRRQGETLLWKPESGANRGCPRPETG